MGFRTQNIMFLEGGQDYITDSSININANYPKIIYVTCNCIDHSLYCSKQKKILNYSPIDFISTNRINHRFKNPIKHKAIA